MKKFFVALALFAAVVGVLLAFVRVNFAAQPKAEKPAGHMTAIIPEMVGAFTSKEKPIGNTEEVARAAEKYLAVSEYFNRSYSDGNGTEFTVYISYWGEGKESTIRASAHTPDRCWVENGWKNIEQKKKFNEVFSVNGKKLMPAYYREFAYKTDSGIARRNVVFWFVVNGKRYDYGTSDNAIPSLKKYFQNMLRDAFTVSPECYFVRVDSSQDIYQLMQNKDFLTVMDALGKLILYQK